MKKMIFAAFAALLTVGCINPTENENKTITGAIPRQTDRAEDISIKRPDHTDSLIALATAFAIQESNLDERAISPCGRYVGCLQISRIMVREANRICCADIFFSDTNVFCDDRLDRQGSLAIFSVVQEYHNPTLNVDKAVDIWNPRCDADYMQNVKSYFDNVLADSTLQNYFE